jgi:signal transduction histidine kinase
MLENIPRTRIIYYGVAILAVAIALLVTLQVTFLAERMSLALCFAAIVFSTWYGGRGPGIAALLLSIIGGEYFIILPRFPEELSWDVALPLITFIPLTLLVIWLMSALQKRALSLQASEAEVRNLNTTLEQRVVERTTDLETANSELKKSRAVFENLFESLPGLYLVLTPELKIVTASNEYLKATMTTLEGITGRDLFEVFPDNPDDMDASGVSNLQASLNRVRQTKAIDVMAIQKYDIRRPDGIFEEHYWSPRNSPVFGEDNKMEYIVHRVENVTDFMRQKSKEESSQENLETASQYRFQQMEIEIYQSTQKIQEINRQLEASNRELESFSYSVSHDLRAPLRHINGFSEALLEDYTDKLDDTGKNYLNRLTVASKEMAQLIDDILELSRVTRTEIHAEKINLSEMVSDLLERMQKAEPERSVNISVETDLVGFGDKRLLGAVLANLLGNAWKFTAKREKAEIAFGYSSQNGNSGFFVRDNGAGFEMAYANKLFGVFQRLHKASEFEGTGVGLATVQRIINRHGGNVWAESEVDKGATFYFTLPSAGE